MSQSNLMICSIILIIVILLIIINIKAAITDKLSNVAVNIPPINIPPPEITVKVQKSCDSNKFDVFFDKNTNGQNHQTVALSPISTPANSEHFGNILPKKSKNKDKKNKDTLHTSKPISSPKIKPLIGPNFMTKTLNAIIKKKKPKKSKDNKKKSKSNKKTVKVINNINDLEKTSEFDIKFPDEDNVVEYGDYMCAGNTQLRNKIFSSTFSTIKSPKVTNAMSEDNYDTNITDMYENEQKFVKSYLEDPSVRGYNLSSYDNCSPMFTTGNISIKKDVEYPKPSGYIFKGSSVSEKPE